MNNNCRVGIIGGSFDPVHMAHIKLAECAYRELQLEKVIFVPAYIQPFKKDRKVTDEIHRINMLKLALSEYPYFEVSDIEIRMKGDSYTARTLTVLESEYPDMVFIMGADSYMSLERWYHPEIVFQKAHIACAVRDDSSMDKLKEKEEQYREKYQGTTYFLNMPRTDMSSTDIRDRISNGDSLNGSISENVMEYIKEHKLYECR